MAKNNVLKIINTTAQASHLTIHTVDWWRTWTRATNLLCNGACI